MLKKILVGTGVVLASIVAVLVIVIALQPSTFEIKRSRLVRAPSSVVFQQVNDYHNWEAWSPWAHLDPNMKTTFRGAQSGTGAIYEWSGNDQVGKGRQTIVKSVPNRVIEIKLEFLEPWTATNQTEFAFAGVHGGTNVTWSMRGENTFMGKAFGLFMDMDQMVGRDFEKGLAKLDQVSSSIAKNVAASP